MATSRSVDELARLLDWLPLDDRTVSWTRVEDELDRRCPDDYRQFAEVFGSGVFENAVGVYSPVQTEATLSRFLRDAEETLSLVRERPEAPYPVEDLLPWGEAEDGQSLFLLPDGDVVVCDDAFSVWERHPSPVAAFLLDLFTGRLRSDLLAFEPVDRPTFWPSATGSPPATAPVNPELWRRTMPGIAATGPTDLVDELGLLIDAASGRAVDWAAVERDVGIAFPADYRRFVDRFGAGEFGGIRVHVPSVDLADLVEEVRATVRGGRPLPGAPYFPEPGGLVPWGRTATGHIFFWAPVTDHPDTWPVLMAPPGLVGHNEFRRSMSSLLHGRLSGAEGDIRMIPEGNGK